MTNANDRYARMAVAAVAVALVYAVSSNGLFFPGFADFVQVGLLAALVAGMLAPDAVMAAAAALAGLAAGVALQPAGVWPAPADVLVTLAVGAVVAGLVRLAIGSGALRPSLGMVLALTLVAGNLWLTASTVATTRLKEGTLPSTFEVLAHRPAYAEKLGDSGFYRRVVWRMRDGEPYYQAYDHAWADTWRVQPASLFGVRQPTLFMLWATLPAWPKSAFFAFLVFVTAAVVAAPFVSSRAVAPPLAVFAAAGVGAYLLRFALEPGLLFLQEEWGGAVAVVVFALYALAQDERRHRPLMAAAAFVAMLAVTLRELMVFVVLAGLVAAFFSDRRFRRFDLVSWAAALAGALAYWGVHAMRARALYAGRVPDPTPWLVNAGLSNLLHGVTDSTVLLNAHAWVPVALAVLGVAGALAQPDRQFRVFATAAVLMPLTGFLFAWNGALDVTYATASNYWGAIVMPALLALAPSALLLLPGLRRPATAQATEEQGRAETAEPSAASG